MDETVIIGMDPHKASNTIAVLDSTENSLSRRRFAPQARRRQEHKEALRCLMRRISDAAWRQLQLDRSPEQTQDQAWPRWRSKRGNAQQYRSPDTLRMNGRPQPFKPAAV